MLSLGKHGALLLLLVTLACQSRQGRHRASPEVTDPIPDRAMGPIVESEDADPSESAIPVDNSAPDPQPDVEVIDYIGSVDLQSNYNLPFGLPKLTDRRASILISRAEYVLSWNMNTRTVNWAAWSLRKEDLGSEPRQERFNVDPDLQIYLSKRGVKAVSSSDYTGSCFDRGHLVPSADRTSNADSNAATFMMSNILPQTAYLNRVMWVKHENETRNLLKGGEHEKLWVITGPIYKGNYRYIGANEDIAVPQFNFKVIYSVTPEPKLLSAVIMPNVTSEGTDPMDDRDTLCSESSNPGALSHDIKDYIVEPQRIEAEAQLDLPSP